MDLLPAEAREILIRAANTPIPFEGSLSRQIAIEKATEYVKAMYPSYFIKD